MKGMSLAIEAVIIMIIAVSVLTVLMMIFRAEAGEVEDILELRRQQVILCGQYVEYAGADVCDSDTATGFTNGVDLKIVCVKLKYDACSRGTNLDCFKVCCNNFMSCI